MDLDIDGLMVFIARVPPDAAIEASPKEPYLGLDHFGFRVEHLDETVAELKTELERLRTELKDTK